MAAHILANSKDDQAVLYCSTTDWAFGPVFQSLPDLSASEMAQAFIDWLPQDPRHYQDHVLESKYNKFLADEPWKESAWDENVEADGG